MIDAARRAALLVSGVTSGEASLERCAQWLLPARQYLLAAGCEHAREARRGTVFGCFARVTLLESDDEPAARMRDDAEEEGARNDGRRTPWTLGSRLHGNGGAPHAVVEGKSQTCSLHTAGARHGPP